MFNIGGGEVIVILIIALIVLGPDKLPDAVRRAGRLYGELRRMSSGFQAELRDALDEPMSEIRSTTDLVKRSFTGDDDDNRSDAGPPPDQVSTVPAGAGAGADGDDAVAGDRPASLPPPSGAAADPTLPPPPPGSD